jgi:peptide/nickel transport system ATP-binding protein
MAPLLEARGISKVFHSGIGAFGRSSNVALDDFSITIDEDRPTVTAIAGESGSGKTTLARVLLGIAAPSSGEMEYRGKNLARMDSAERKAFRREVQAIFQDPFEVYNPYYKVDHVLTTPVAKFNLAANRSEGRTLIEEALRKVGLRPEETLGRYPHQLSGGQRQRVMIARALLLQPRIIVADEPVSMVDASLRATILDSLLRLHKEFGISLIYITHDLTTAYQLCDSIVVLYRGMVAERGDVALTIRDPKHPYTQLLVDSIPKPDPDTRWGSAELAQSDATEAVAPGERACKFASRCPHRMERCLHSQPPLLPIEPERSVACFLYQEEQPKAVADATSPAAAA